MYSSYHLEMKIWACLGQVISSKFDEICPLAIPNQISTIINAHTKFGENPLMFTQAIIPKQNTDRRMYGRMDGGTDSRMFNVVTIIPLHYHVAGYQKAWILIVLGFNDTSTLEGHFVSSPREREKRDRRESRGDEREGQGRKRNRKESEETEEIKTFPLYPYPLQG